MRKKSLLAKMWMNVTGLAVAVMVLLGLIAPGVAQAETCPTAKASRRYTVNITSVPAGATVYLGTRECGPVGVTPWSGKLASGDVNIIVEAAGYEPATKAFKVARTRRVQTVALPLIKKADPPRIEIRADADKNLFDANVSIDGQPQGRVPLVITTVPGRHLIEIRKDGFEPLSTWVEVKENEKANLTPVLKEIAKPKFGTIVVEADVPDAEVYVDGNKHPDNTPTVISGVIEGMHVVEVRKAPMTAWKQTVQVVADQQVKVSAGLKATGAPGTITILSNAEGAKIFVNGAEVGAPPYEFKDAKPGDYIIEVRAPGHNPRIERVSITAGQAPTVLKLDLAQEAGRADEGVLKVVSPVPDAEVYVDGASVGKVPVDKRIASGEHFVVVKVDGFKEFQAKIRVDAGQTVTVKAELKAVGKLRVLSNPSLARVFINGELAGETPLNTEVEVGAAVVRIERDGYLAIDQNLTIVGGKSEVISGDLQVAGPSAEELLNVQRGLSSFGARTLPRGSSTVDLGIGYPYLAEVRVNVGAGSVKNFGFDAGVGLRTMLARNEIGLGVRFQLVNNEPFSLGAFGDLWYGSKLLDDSKRNGATFNAGGIASLTALSNVTITGRLYASMWSDRHCPPLKDDGTFDGEPTDACEGYKARVVDGGDPAGFTQVDADRMESLTGERGTGMFGREGGLRLMTSIAAEIAWSQRWNIWAMLEGAPFQSERALYTDMFSAPMFDSDYGTYLRLGMSYKF